MRMHAGVIAASGVTDPLLDALTAAGLFGYVPAVGKVWQERDGSHATEATADGDLVGEIEEYTGIGPSALAASDGARGILRIRGGLRWIEVDGADGGYTLGNAVITDAMTTASYFAGIRVDSIAPARQWVISRFINQGDWNLNNWGGFGIREHLLYAEIPGATGAKQFDGNARVAGDLRMDEIHNGGGGIAGSSDGITADNSPLAQGTPLTGSTATLLFKRDHLFGADPFAGEFYGLAIGVYVAAGAARDDVRTQVGILAGKHLNYLTFAPSDIAGLVFDYDMLTSQYSDTGATSQQTTDTGAVRSLKDGSIVAVTAALDATRHGDAGGVKALLTGTNTYFSTSGASIDRRDFSLHLNVRPNVVCQPLGQGLFGLGNGENVEITDAGLLRFHAGGSTVIGTVPVPPENVVISFIANGTNISVRYNGEVVETIPATFTAGTAEIDLFGGSDLGATCYLRGVIQRAALCSPAATTLECQKIEELFQRKYPPTQLSYTKVGVVFHGNSLVSDGGFTPPIMTILGSGYTRANRGLAGQTTPQMVVSGPVDADPYFDDTRTGNTLVGWEITNDLRVNDPSTATLLANYRAYRAARESVFGAANVILLDCLPATDLTVGNGKEAKRVATNGDLAAEYSIATADSLVWQKAGGGLLVKVSEIPELADPSDTDYYSDGLHLTTAAYALIATRVAAAVALV